MSEGIVQSATRDPESVSHDHVDYVLRRRRQEAGRLAIELGGEITGKLHPWLVGDLIADRREEQLAQLFGEPPPDPARRRVMMSLRGARQLLTTDPDAEPRDRQAVIDGMRRTGELGLQRLLVDLEEIGASVEETYWLTQSAVAQVTAGQIERIAARADVSSVTSLKPQFVACLDVSRPLIQADQVQAAGITGAGITVAIIDSGVDASHPALTAVVGPQTDVTAGAAGLVPAVARDDLGHGTHCAGIVASQDATFVGIAPGAQLTDIRIIDVNNVTTAAVAVAGLTAAVTAAVDVASNSWGFSHANGNWVDADGTCVLCTAADNAVASGVCVVVSAGNDDNDTCRTYDTHINCPGMANTVITVGATDDADVMWNASALRGSSIGPTPDGRTKPDITAPGVRIASCQATGTSLGPVVAPGFINSTGTSMAVPHVAGVAALMLSVNNTLPPATVSTILTATAVNIGFTPNEMGSGRVDALAAVNRVPQPPP